MYYQKWSNFLSSRWHIAGDEVIISHHADVLPEMKKLFAITLTYYRRWSNYLTSRWRITRDEVIIGHHIDALQEIK
jgi:hypothetical protein